MWVLAWTLDSSALTEVQFSPKPCFSVALLPSQELFLLGSATNGERSHRNGLFLTAETPTLHSKRNFNGPRAEWVFADLADNSQRGTSERIKEKMMKLSQYTHSISMQPTASETEARFFDVERRFQEAEIAREEAERRIQVAQTSKEEIERRYLEAESRVEEANRGREKAERRENEAEERSQEAEQRREEAEARSQEAEKGRNEAERRSQEAEQRREEAEARSQEAERGKSVAERRSQEAEQRRDEAEARSQEAERRREEMERRFQEAIRNREEAEREFQEAISGRVRAERGRQNAERGRQEAERTSEEVERRSQEFENRVHEAERRAHDAEKRAQEAERRAQEAERVRLIAVRERQEAESDRQEAERVREEAERNKRDAESRARDIERLMEERELQNADAENSRHWQVQRGEINMTDQILGGGGWGEVKVATFRGIRVAAKVLYAALQSPYYHRAFTREMNMASRCRHPNLVQFIGASVDEEMVILMELMPTSLRQHLTSNAPAIPSSAFCISVSHDVAKALNYLHLMQPHPIIHRDISSANVLLEALPNQKCRAKVTDYGSVNLQNRLNTENPGNPVYSAPEACTPSRQTIKMDTFSFGILLLEMRTAEFPDEEKKEAMIRTIRERRWVNLIQQCILRDTTQRLTMSQIITRLTSWQ